MTVTGKIQKYKLREQGMAELGITAATVISGPDRALASDGGERAAAMRGEHGLQRGAVDAAEVRGGVDEADRGLHAGGDPGCGAVLR